MPHRTGVPSPAAADPGLSHALLLQLAHYLPSLVAICDAEGKLVHLNPAGRKLIGIDTADIYPYRLNDYIVASQRDLAGAEIVPTARDQGVWQGRTTLLNASTGAEITVGRSTFCVYDSVGNVTGFVSIMDLIATAGPAPAANPVELLIHDFTNLVASVLSGFSLIERRSQEPTIKAIAAQGKKAAEDGLALTKRLKDIC